MKTECSFYVCSNDICVLYATEEFVINTLVTILIAIVIFGSLILIHECGHFMTARMFGVGINEFSIGMGPKIISKISKKSGTAYSLRLLPIGGYVSMKGEDEDVSDPDSFSSKPAWQRMIIIIAGSVMNILLGLILVIVMVLSSKNLGSTVIYKFTSDDAVSAESGLEENDRIVKVGNTSVHTLTELAYEIMHDGTEPIDVTVIRNGEKIVISDVVFPTAVSSGIVIGDLDFYVYEEAKTPLNVLKQSFFQSVSYIKMIWESLFDLVTGKYGMEQMSGPVGITKEIGSAASAGAVNLLYLCAVIALNLGFVNMLPLPALDGGRFFFILIELIRGKPIKPKYEGYVHLAGMVLLLVLMVIITFGDIRKLITGA